jgi:hypothetical protein
MTIRTHEVKHEAYPMQAEILVNKIFTDSAQLL